MISRTDGTISTSISDYSSFAGGSFDITVKAEDFERQNNFSDTQLHKVLLFILIGFNENSEGLALPLRCPHCHTKTWRFLLGSLKIRLFGEELLVTTKLYQLDQKIVTEPTLPYLTFSQVTNSKLFPNWKSLQTTTISNLIRMAESFQNRYKTLWEKEKLLVTSNFSFFPQWLQKTCTVDM